MLASSWVSSSAGATPKKVVRQVFGSGKGHFRTRAKYAIATVRGTSWSMQDRCDGTLVTVTQGSVAVKDLTRGTTTTITAGKSTLIKPR